MRKSLENINQREFAKALNVSESTVSYILSGQRKPSLGLAKKMAVRLGTGLDQFLVDLSKERDRRLIKSECRKYA